jgi:hypothetical protein
MRPRKGTAILTIHCPNHHCDRVYDFISPPAVFSKLCGCGTFFLFERGSVQVHNPQVIPNWSKDGSTTVAPSGEKPCANVDKKPFDLKSPEKWG